LLYGDGVFEGIRVYNGCIFRLPQHLERLHQSAQGIQLRMPLSMEEMEQAIIETVRANEERDAYIRVVVTRGVGDLGLSPKKCPEPGYFIIVGDVSMYSPELYESGLALITAAVRRTPSVCLDPQIKSLNYLNNILAKSEGEHLGYEEVIMLNMNGYVVECTGDNIFIRRNGTLMTPALHLGTLRGVTREVVMEIARELGIPCQSACITRQDVYTAEECFLTGTAAELIPVVEVDGRAIGKGKVGPLTMRLLEAFHARTHIDGTQAFSNVEVKAG